MNNIHRAIQLAVENGYNPLPRHRFANANTGLLEKNGPSTIHGWSCWDDENGSTATLGFLETFMDPLFWSALGKALDWEQDDNKPHKKFMTDWKLEMHRFIDHLIAKKSPDDFFKELLK